jgi:hypothetical protein
MVRPDRGNRRINATHSTNLELSLLGTVSIFRYGAGSQGIMRTLGQYMGASGATFGYVRGGRLHGDRSLCFTLFFGENATMKTDQASLNRFFMSIGSVIRSDTDEKWQELYMRARHRPIMIMANGAWRRNERPQEK